MQCTDREPNSNIDPVCENAEIGSDNLSRDNPLLSATAVLVLEFASLTPLMKSIMNWQKHKQTSLQNLHSSVQCKMCQFSLSVQCHLKQHKTKTSMTQRDWTTSEFPTQVTQGHIQRTSFQIGLHLQRNPWAAWASVFPRNLLNPMNPTCLDAGDI